MKDDITVARVEAIFERHSINEELYNTEELANAYKAGVADGLSDADCRIENAQIRDAMDLTIRALKQVQQQRNKMKSALKTIQKIVAFNEPSEDFDKQILKIIEEAV